MLNKNIIKEPELRLDKNGAWSETEQIITKMLEVTLDRLPLHETLKRCLDVLLKTNWLRIQDTFSIKIGPSV